MPTITATGVSVSPASGIPQDFSTPRTYTVTAADGTTQDYSVTVTVARSSAKDITQLTILGNTGVISGTAIGVTVPNGTDLTALMPTVTHTGVSVSPASGAAQSFSSAVVYTVTADDGTIQAYTVTVTAAANVVPTVSGGPFSVGLPVVDGDVIGTALVSDSDSGQSHAFAITSDSSGAGFAIDATTGVITVADATMTPVGTYTLTVAATDDGTPPETGAATLDIELINAPQPVADGPLTAFASVSTQFNILSNDTAAMPPAALVSFGGGSLGGAVSDHVADGSPIMFAGGTISLAADGELTVNAVTPGSYTFSYRVSNGAVADATVTVAVCSDLAVGGFVMARPEDAPSACVGSSTASANSEYTFVAMNLTSGSTYDLSVITTDTAAISGGATPGAGSTSAGDGHAVFRSQQHAEYNARVGTTGAGTPVTPASSIPHVVPAVNDSWSLNAEVADACSTGTAATGTVQFVGTHSIVVSDDTVPPGGFSAQQYQTFSWNFDNLIYPAVTAAYGEPSDSDENGRVVLFITPAMNRLSPPASSSVYSTRYMPRDHATQTECPTSNAGEIIYILAPDPTGSINSNVRTVASVGGMSTAPLAHEFAHMVLDSKRIAAGAEFESTWLDEGLAGLAEELAFYPATSLGVATVSTGGAATLPATMSATVALDQGANIVLSNLTTGPSASKRVAAFNAFANPNYGRYRPWLQSPRRTGVINDTQSDSLPGRGGNYALLRCLTDRISAGTVSTGNSFLAAVVSSNLTGLDNIAARIGDDSLLWVRDYLVALYVDDTVATLSTTAPYNITTWNYRSIYGGLGGWPLPQPVFTPDIPVTFNLAPAGSSSYTRFAVAPGEKGQVTLTPPAAANWEAWYAIIRSQ